LVEVLVSIEIWVVISVSTSVPSVVSGSRSSRRSIILGEISIALHVAAAVVGGGGVVIEICIGGGVIVAVVIVGSFHSRWSGVTIFRNFELNISV